MTSLSVWRTKARLLQIDGGSGPLPLKSPSYRLSEHGGFGRGCWVRSLIPIYPASVCQLGLPDPPPDPGFGHGPSYVIKVRDEDGSVEELRPPTLQPVRAGFYA
jgi:hypothetical protein